MILAQNTQELHVHPAKAHANFIPLMQPLGCAVDTTVCKTGRLNASLKWSGFKSTSFEAEYQNLQQ